MSGLGPASEAVLREVAEDLVDTPVVLVVADRSARVVMLARVDRSVGRAVDDLGVRPGLSLAESTIGTNAVGTPAETREACFVRGPEHASPAFHPFTCYGQPILHPVTHRLVGVLAIGGRTGPDYRLAPSVARRVVRDIEQRLQVDAVRAQHRLFSVFQDLTRTPTRPVMVIGEGLVLPTDAALDMLDPADHAAIRAMAERGRSVGTVEEHLTLVSGRSIVLRCVPADGTDGVVVDMAPLAVARREVERCAAWPVLVVGEAGSGRTTRALSVAGADAITVEAAEALHHGERRWMDVLGAHLRGDGVPVVVEDVHLLSEQASVLVTRLVRTTPRRVVLTAIADRVDGGLAGRLATVCRGREEVVPLRMRRHEIPRIATRMLAESTRGGTRLTAETLRELAAQPWPGNLAELRGVVDTVAAARSAGDIVPADLPRSHRGWPVPTSPVRQAERAQILAAIDAHCGNRLRAARELGISRSTLYNRMRVLGIS